MIEYKTELEMKEKLCPFRFNINEDSYCIGKSCMSFIVKQNRRIVNKNYKGTYCVKETLLNDKILILDYGSGDLACYCSLMIK